MSTGIKSVLAFSLLASLGACIGPGGGAGSSPGNRDVITLAEIQETQAGTAYDVVQELRPRWMARSRGVRSFGEGSADFPRVVLDDLPQREFDFLREIPRDVLLEIRYLSAREATFLYGTGYNAGIIKVTSKR